MARPRSFNPDDVLRIAIDLFWEKGYCDSSVDEVVRRSGVAKYGIYGEFGSKRELFNTALKQYAIERHRDIQAPIRDQSAALPEIKKFLRNAVKIIKQDKRLRGCLIVNTGVELGLRDDDIRKFVANFFDETKTVMEQCLKNAINKGQISSRKDVSSLASYLVTEFRTALMLASSGVPRKQIENHLELAMHVLD